MAPGPARQWILLDRHLAVDEYGKTLRVSIFVLRETSDLM